MGCPRRKEIAVLFLEGEWDIGWRKIEVQRAAKIWHIHTHKDNMLSNFKADIV